MPGVEIRVQMHENKLGPFLESLPAKLAYHVFKVISEIYIHKAVSGGRPPAGYNDEAWPPLSQWTIYRKMLAEHRRRRARLWRIVHTSYASRRAGKIPDDRPSATHIDNRFAQWTNAAHIAGAKEDIQAQRRQRIYGAPPPGVPTGDIHEGVTGTAGGDEEEYLRAIQRSVRARRRVARLIGVPIRRVRRASLPPRLRGLWKRMYHITYAELYREARASGMRSAPARRHAAQGAARRAWRAVITRAENLAYIAEYDDPSILEMINASDPRLRRARVRAAIGKSFLARYRLRQYGFLESSLVLMMIDSGAIYNSLLPGTVGRDDRTGSTVYIINRRRGRGGFDEDRQHRRPGQICSITVHGSTTDSPLRAEVTIGVRVVDRVEVGKGANRTVVEVPYALYHHYGSAVRQEGGRRGPRPKRRLWPADLARLLEVAVTRLLRASRVDIGGQGGESEGAPT